MKVTFRLVYSLMKVAFSGASVSRTPKVEGYLPPGLFPDEGNLQRGVHFKKQAKMMKVTFRQAYFLMKVTFSGASNLFLDNQK